MTYRAAVIGCGAIGAIGYGGGIDSHVAAYQAHAKIQLTALIDSNPALLRRSAQAAHLSVAHCYPQIEAYLYNLEPSALAHFISIATPDATHYALTIQLLSQSILAHRTGAIIILIEKPLALSSLEAQKMIRLAHRQQVLLCLNYSRRFCPAHLRVKKLIDGGKLGAIQAISGSYTKGLLHNGGHLLDLLMWFFGPIQAVLASANSAAPYQEDESPHVTVVFQQESRSPAQKGGRKTRLRACILGLDAQNYSVFEWDLFFEKGRIRSTDGGRRIEFYAIEESPYYAGYQTPVLKLVDTQGGQDNLMHVVDQMVHTLENNSALPCSGAQGLAVLQVVEAARASLKSHTWVRVDS